jgi:hypothetical protein
LRQWFKITVHNQSSCQYTLIFYCASKLNATDDYLCFTLEGHWMNESLDTPIVRIGISESPRIPSPFSQLMEVSETKESRKLSDLFNDPQSSSASEGQSFFDTLNKPNISGETFLVPVKTEAPAEVKLQDGGFATIQASHDPFQGLPSNKEPQGSIQDPFQSLDSFQDQPLVPDQFESQDVPTEPPHKSLEDIVKAEQRSQPGFIGEQSMQQSFQFVQQPFPTPLITQHHLQDASIPQQAFQPSTIPVTPTCLQTMKVYQDPLHDIQTQPKLTSNLASHDHNRDLGVHSPIPSVPDIEVHSKQTEEDLLTSAWIPSLQTSHFLTTIGSGMMNKADIDQQYLTSPGIVIDSPQV